MRSFSTNWKLVFVFVAVLIILPILVYWWKFGSLGLSPDFKTWVNFSTYWSPYLVTALTIILTYISWQSLELMKLKEKPVLVIEEYPEYRGEGNSGIPTFFYRVKNLGEGPALNMKLFVRISESLISVDTFLFKKHLINDFYKIHEKYGFHYMVHSFSLPSKLEMKINWQFHVEEFAIVYEDLHGTTYTLGLKNKGTYIKKYDSIGIDKFGKKGSERVFSDGEIYNQSRSPKRIFTLEECYR
jgi:hypothetical protein